MTRRNPAPVAPTGELDKQVPIIRNFEDGREVSTWMNVIRSGGTPGVDLHDQLKAAGWQHVSVVKVMEIVDQKRRQPIGYAAIAKILSRKGCEIELELTDIVGKTYQVALNRNEATLLHGHTNNTRGPVTPIRLRVSYNPQIFGGLLIKRR